MDEELHKCICLLYMPHGLCGFYIDSQDDRKSFTEKICLENENKRNAIKNIKPPGLQNSLALNANGAKASYVFRVRVQMMNV